MTKLPRAIALAMLVALALLAAPARAQQRPADSPAPVLRIEAQATREVTDDTAVMVFFVERDGAQSSALQSSVNLVLQAALAELKRDTALQVRSGAYHTMPRNNREGRIEGWRVRAELIAETTDMAAISRASATLSGRMSVASIGFRLSGARRTETENALTTEAAERFFARARAAAKALGYPEIELVEANFNAGSPPVAMARASFARGEMAADAAPVPIEPGRSQVTVSISGALRLRRP